MTKLSYSLIVAAFLSTPFFSVAQDGPIIPGELEILRPLDKNNLGPKQIEFNLSAQDRQACNAQSENKSPRLVFTRNASANGPDLRVLHGAQEGAFLLMIEGELAGGRDGLSMLLNHHGLPTASTPTVIDGLEDAVPLAITRTLEFHDMLSAIPGPHPRAVSLLMGRAPGEIVVVRPHSHSLDITLPAPNPYNSKELKDVYVQTQEIERRLVWEAVRNPFLRSRLLALAHRSSLEPEVRVLALELVSEAEAGVAHTISPKKIEKGLDVPLNVLPFKMQKLLERLVVEELNEALKLLSTEIISGPSIKYFEFDPAEYKTLDEGYDHELAGMKAAKGFNANLLLKHWREFSAANNIRTKFCEATKTGKDLVVWVAPEMVPGIINFLSSGRSQNSPAPVVSQVYSASSK